MPDMIGSIIGNFWDVLCDMAPYLLFGFLMAGVLSVLISARAVERHLGGPGLLPVVKASLFGVPLPLCSCGVIPVAASLRRSGASKGATSAFLISTPQTGVDSILVTLSLLGPIYAVFRPVAALFAGLVGGGLVTLICPEEQEEGHVHSERPAAGRGEGEERQRGAFTRAVRYGFVTLPRDLGWSLVIGLAIAGMIAVFVPAEFFANVLGTGIVAMLVMLAAGLPVYVCATASVPVAAVLIAKGISPGAALVFLMTGPATNAATIATVWKFLGRRSTVIYLAAVAGTALCAGIALDSIFIVQSAVPEPYMPWMIPGIVKTISAVTLLAILGYAMFGGRKKPAASSVPDEGMQRAQLSIRGMSCNHCAEGVQDALAACGGVASVSVDLKSGTAVVRGEDFDTGSLLRAVERLGYSASASGGLGNANPRANEVK